MFKQLILAGMLVAPCGMASADTVKVIGAGAKASCGTWLEYRTNNIAQSLEQWSIGYLSGVAMNSADLNPLNNLDLDAVMYWLDKHCRDNPLKSLTDALDAFVTEHPR